MAEPNEPAAPPDSPVHRTPPAVPRRNRSAERQTAPPTSELNDRLSVLVDSVKDLATHLGTADGEPDAKFAKDRSARRVKKFQRSGLADEQPAANPSEAVAPENGTSSDGERPPDAAAVNKNVAWPRTAGLPVEGEAEIVPGRPPRKRPGKTLIAAVVYGAGLALTTFGFLGGRLTAPDPEEAPTAAPPPMKTSEGGGYFRVSERALEAANAALHAASSGDPDTARRLYQEALDQHLDLPGVQYQLARLAIQRGDLHDADLHQDRSSGAGEAVVPCCYARARYAASKGKYEEVVRQFQAAAHVEPFNAHCFFYWGEALRRCGQAQIAADVLSEALDREHTADEGELYLFKLRLAKAESGADPAFNAELADHLKREPAEPEWLLVGAARDIAHLTQPKMVAEALREAASMAPAGWYEVRIKDYVFQSVRDDPTFAALVKRAPLQDSSETFGPFLDPTIAPAALADPAIWPWR